MFVTFLVLKNKVIFSDEVNLFFEATRESDPTSQEVDPHSLFGDSDDSDWEGLDGGE